MHLSSTGRELCIRTNNRDVSLRHTVQRSNATLMTVQLFVDALSNDNNSNTMPMVSSSEILNTHRMQVLIALHVRMRREKCEQQDADVRRLHAVCLTIETHTCYSYLYFRAHIGECIVFIYAQRITGCISIITILRSCACRCTSNCDTIVS